MSEPTENGAEAQTEQFDAAVPYQQPKSSNTRTILEIVGAVVAVGAIFMAGILGFGAGWFAGKHDKRHDDSPQMTMRFEGGLGDRGNGFGGGQSDRGYGFGGGDQSMPELPDDLQQWLEQFGKELGQGMGGGQDTAPAPAPEVPAPSTAPNS